MFEIDPGIAAQGAAARSAFAAGSNARVADHFEGLYHRWMDHARKLEARVRELELALAVKQAAVEADNAVLAEWKRLHPQSPLRQAVGKKRDGSPMLKATAIWITAFDAEARKRGISNPEAHRIS